MIQELFGGGAAGLLNRDRNLPISGVFEPSPSPSPSSSTTNANAHSHAPTNATTLANNAPTTSENNNTNQKLRCPRCDSSNTKFCYYNNYNLTQPRHFCKTCRRYWTKGGALRNVPIGGGCRKNKGTTLAAAVGKPISATGKLKAVVSSELGRSGYLNGFEHEFAPNPILWSGGPPQTSHLLSLLRATQNPNPNPNPNPNFASNSVSHMKDQNFMVGSNLGFEPSSLGLCTSLWRNNQNHHDQQQQQGMIMATGHEVQENNPSGGQRYQRLRSSSSSPSQAHYYHHHDHQTTPLILGNNTSSSTTATTTILDSAPVLANGHDQLGFWNNQNISSWSDLPTANGAYP